MKIKPLRTDAPYLDQVTRWLFDEWSPISPFETLAGTREALQFRAAGQLLPSTYVAEGEDDNVLGTVSLVECDYAPRSDLSPWVADMFVEPRQRNRGIGSELVRHSEMVAARAGIESLYLITRTRQTFYEPLEWQVIDRISYEGVTAALMRRGLK